MFCEHVVVSCSAWSVGLVGAEVWVTDWASDVGPCLTGCGHVVLAWLSGSLFGWSCDVLRTDRRAGSLDSGRSSAVVIGCGTRWTVPGEDLSVPCDESVGVPLKVRPCYDDGCSC